MTVSSVFLTSVASLPGIGALDSTIYLIGALWNSFELKMF